MGQQLKKIGIGVAGGLVGTLAGAVTGVVTGIGYAKGGEKEALNFNIGFWGRLKRWFPQKTIEENKKILHLGKQSIEYSDDNKTTALCAEMSCWMYTGEQQLVKVPSIILGWPTVEGLLKGSLDDAYEFPPGEYKLIEESPTQDENEKELQTHVAEQVNDVYRVVHPTSMQLYIRKGNLELCGDARVDMKEELKNLLRGKYITGELSATKAIERCMWWSGGALSPSVASMLFYDDTAEDGEKRTLYIAWQGTQVKERPMDFFTDLGAAPVRANLWHDQFPDVWVHGAIYAKVQNDFCANQNTILGAIVAKHLLGQPVDRLIFTGHSLGGGCALVAHMVALSIVDQFPNDDNEIDLPLPADEKGTMVMWKHLPKDVLTTKFKVPQATYTVIFKPGEMGITYDDEGVVEETSAHMQTGAHRISKGDQIVRVGNEEYSKDAVIKTEQSGAYYEVTFKASPCITHKIVKEALKNLAVGSIAFAAPMVFFIPATLSGTEEKVRAIRERYKRSSVNHAFDKDVVPRLPGQPQFYKSAIQKAFSGLVKEHAPVLAETLAETARDACNVVFDAKALEQTWADLKRFEHFSTIKWCRYNGEEAKEPISVQQVNSKEEFNDIAANAPFGDDDDAMYLFACHMWLPYHIEFNGSSTGTQGPYPLSPNKQRTSQ